MAPPRPIVIRTKTVAGYLGRLGYAEPSESRERFLSPKLADLTSPSAMVDRDAATDRLARAIRQKERVVVFGDYDCDGMTSTAILTEALRALGAASVEPVLASRFDGGYGLSARALERVLALEPHLVVTCDCGSSDHASLRGLAEKNVDVVVIDHHLVPDEPLPALAFLNPHRPECGFPYKGLASCGLVLSIVASLRTALGVELDVRSWLDLVAIGTIADVAPLDGDNRALVRAGLRELGKRQRPGLLALLDLIGIDGEHPLAASDVSFRIAPRLNAPGRLGSPEAALSLMLERDADKARMIAAEVEQLCVARREEQKRIEEEARLDAAAFVEAGATALVLGRANWNHGIVGIVAGRLAEEHGCPVIVVGFEGDVGRGSVRGPAGFPLFDALEAASEHLVRFGGHQAAAGLEVRAAQLDAFRESFVSACAARSEFERPSPSEPLDWIEGDEAAHLLEDLHQLEPCGHKNPAPELRVRALVRSAREVKGGHLKLELEHGGRSLSGFGPGLGAWAKRLGAEVIAIGQLRPDRFRGGGAVEMLVTRFIEPETSR